MRIEVTGTYFARNLLYLREQNALSLRALAKLIGISQHTLKCIERQTAPPELPFEAFERICEVFHLDSYALTKTDLTVNAPGSVRCIEKFDDL